MRLIKKTTTIAFSLCTAFIPLLIWFLYDNLLVSLSLCLVIICAFYLYRSKPNSGNTSISRKVVDHPDLLLLKRRNIIVAISLLESDRALQRTVFDASTELVGLTDENDARQRFTSTLNIYWSSKKLDLYVWERGIWHSLGGVAYGSEPNLIAPVQLPDIQNRDLILDLSPGVDGQAAVILRDAKPQPTIINRSLADQQYIAEVLRGQLVLSLRRVKLYNQLEDLGRTDPLTLVHRRWYGLHRLQEFLGSPSISCIAFLDIDLFKAINDTHGHQIGDQVLRRIGDTLNKTLRSGDFSCRFGGEEFLLIFPFTTILDALHIVERVRSQIAHFIDLPCSVTVSIGLCTINQQETAEQVINRADAAMYEAKTQGRNQVKLAADC